MSVGYGVSSTQRSLEHASVTEESLPRRVPNGSYVPGNGPQGDDVGSMMVLIAR